VQVKLTKRAEEKKEEGKDLVGEADICSWELELLGASGTSLALAEIPGCHLCQGQDFL
jgi:hypothetical protein